LRPEALRWLVWCRGGKSEEELRPPETRRLPAWR
jgi:hypothetical protein